MKLYRLVFLGLLLFAAYVHGAADAAEVNGLSDDSPVEWDVESGKISLRAQFEAWICAEVVTSCNIVLNTTKTSVEQQLQSVREELKSAQKEMEEYQSYLFFVTHGFKSLLAFKLVCCLIKILRFGFKVILEAVKILLQPLKNMLFAFLVYSLYMPLRSFLDGLRTIIRRLCYFLHEKFQAALIMCKIACVDFMDRLFQLRIGMRNLLSHFYSLSCVHPAAHDSVAAATGDESPLSDRFQIGLRNNDGTCFLNAALQIPRSIPEIQELLSSDWETKGPYSSALYKLFSQMDKLPRDNKILPSEIETLLGSEFPRNEMEALDKFLNELHLEWNSNSKDAYLQTRTTESTITEFATVFLNNYKARNESMIDGIFRGFRIRRIPCDDHDKIFQFFSSNYVCLPAVFFQDNQFVSLTSLEQCLGKWAESVKAKCLINSCGNDVDKFIRFFKLPKILIICLKLSKTDEYGIRHYSDKKIIPPMTLDMKPYVHPEFAESKTEYEFLSFVPWWRRGEGPHHVSAVFKSPDTGAWIHANDSKIVSVTPEPDFNDRSQPRILIYSRKN